jgi:hypothetical protein
MPCEQALNVAMRALSVEAMAADKRAVRAATLAIHAERASRRADARASDLDESLVKALEAIGGTWVDLIHGRRFELSADVRGWKVTDLAVDLEKRG